MELTYKCLIVVLALISFSVVTQAADLVISSSTTLCGVQTYDNVIINNSAVVTICAYNGTDPSGTLTFNVANLTLASGSTINGTRKGRPGSSTRSVCAAAPGGGRSASSGGGGGGGYGGAGHSNTTTCGTIFGNAGYVNETGAGGGAGWDYNFEVPRQGGTGGGLITINSSGLINISGSITASGGTGVTSSAVAGGSGSGGGVYILTNRLSGSLTISTQGAGVSGTDTSSCGGGGGGGRILIQYCTNNSFTYSLDSTAAQTSSCNGGGYAAYGSDGTTNVSLRTDCNSAPIFTQSPTSFSLHHNQNLSVQLNATDADGDTIIWGINTTMVTINSSGYLSDDPLQAEQGNYSIKVNITDNNVSLSNLVFTYEIINSVPTIASATITPDPAADANDLTCNNGSVSDYELDTLTLYYNWYKNSGLTGNNTKVLGNGNTSVADQWYCKINITDGLFYSGPVTSQTVIIGSSFSAPSLNYTNATTTTTLLTSSTANPTNNNSWVNLSITFYDPNVDKWTAYFCKSNIFNGISCTGGEFCHSAINSTTYPSVNCNYTVSPETASVVSYWVYVVDNTTLTQGSGSGLSGSFNVNHPPAQPSLQSPLNASWVNLNSSILQYLATDSDSDILTYYIYADNISSPANLVNKSLGLTFNWSALNNSNYYWKVLANDSHGYESVYSLTNLFKVDTIPPNISDEVLAGSPYYTDSTVTIYVNCTDSNSGINTSLVKYNITNILTTTDEYMSLYSTNQYIDNYLPYAYSPYNVPGTYTISQFSCSDIAGNIATYPSSLSFTTSIRPVPPAGGGTTPIEIILNNTLPAFCGNGVCDTGESPGSCLADCKINFDDLITCTLKDPKTCFYSASWFVNLLLFAILVGGVLIFVLENNKAFKSKRVRVR
jgi:hypothetical protein